MFESRVLPRVPTLPRVSSLGNWPSLPRVSSLGNWSAFYSPEESESSLKELTELYLHDRGKKIRPKVFRACWILGTVLSLSTVFGTITLGTAFLSGVPLSFGLCFSAYMLRTVKKVDVETLATVVCVFIMLGYCAIVHLVFYRPSVQQYRECKDLNTSVVSAQFGVSLPRHDKLRGDYCEDWKEDLATAWIMSAVFGWQGTMTLWVYVFRLRMSHAMFVVATTGTVGVCLAANYLSALGLLHLRFFQLLYYPLGGSVLLPQSYITDALDFQNFKMQRESYSELRYKSTMLKMSNYEINDMKRKLAASQQLVDQVMNERATILGRYQIKHADIELHEAVGEGSYGTVFRATLRGEREVAVKTMRVLKISQKELDKFRGELTIMCPLLHPNLVRLHGGCWNEGVDKLCIVLEFCPFGSLRTFLRPKRGGKNLTTKTAVVRGVGTWEGRRYGLALGAAMGLRYLHHELNEPLIHRDIKPENILVGVQTVAKLADFGESIHFDQQEAAAQSSAHGRDALTMTLVGTELYAAPEVLALEPYNESADTYSFSLVLLCLAVGDIDYVRKTKRPSAAVTLSGHRPPIPSRLAAASPILAKLIQDMWAHEFRQRPPMKYVVSTLSGVTNLEISCDLEEKPARDDVMLKSTRDLAQN